jgi:hypothetical protein
MIKFTDTATISSYNDRLYISAEWLNLGVGSIYGNLTFEDNVTFNGNVSGIIPRFG